MFCLSFFLQSTHVTRPQFSIAPAANSGMATMSSLGSGKGCPKKSSYRSRLLRATSSEKRPCSAFPGGVYLRKKGGKRRTKEGEGGRRREKKEEGGRRRWDRTEEEGGEGRLVQCISCLSHTHTHTQHHRSTLPSTSPSYLYTNLSAGTLH